MSGTDGDSRAAGARRHGGREPVDVCVTADIEFAINGAFTYPESRSPVGEASVERMIDGRSHGLGFMLDVMREHGLAGSYFVEVMNRHHFGPGEMKRCVDRILACPGNDVQLHMHPCWRYLSDPEWRSRIRTIRKNDSMAGRGAEARELIAEGIELFRAATGADPLAYRSPGLSVDLDVHRALAALGVGISSSVGLGVFTPPDPALRLHGGAALVEGVMEVPVTSYKEIGPRGAADKLLTLTGTPWVTLRAVLEWAYEAQVGPIVMLTHACEFSCPDARRPGEARYRADQPNQRRFRRLCRYLADHADRYRCVTFSEAGARWRERAGLPVEPFRAPLISFAHRAVSGLRSRLLGTALPVSV